MKQCPKCGSSVPDGEAFCTNCGARYEVPEDTPDDMTLPETPEAPLVPPAQTYSPAQPTYPNMAYGAAPSGYVAQSPASLPYPGQGYAPPPQGYAAQQPPVQPMYPNAAYGAVPPGYAGPPPAPPAYPGQPCGQPVNYPSAYAQRYAAQASAPPPSPAWPQGQMPGYPPVYGSAAQTPAAKPPKKKRRWLVPVILGVVLALVAGAYFVFGENLFLSTAKKWQKAERKAFTTSQTSPLYPFGKAVDDFLSTKKKGSVTDITLDIDVPTVPEDVQNIVKVLSNLRIRVDARTEEKDNDLLFFTKLGLAARNAEKDILSAKLYSADKRLVAEVPAIFKKALLLPLSELEDQMDIFGKDSSLQSLRGLILPFIGESRNALMQDVLNIFFKYAEKPQLEKGKLLTVNGVSEKLDCYTVELKADKLPLFVKDLLTYAKSNQDIRNLAEFFLKQNEAESGKSFDEQIDDVIRQIDQNSDEGKGSIQRVLYVNRRDEPVGWTLKLIQEEDGEKKDFASFSWLNAKEGGRVASCVSFSAQMNETGMELLTSYSLSADQRKTGDFSLSMIPADGGKVKIAEGTFDNLRFSWDNGMVQMEGKLTLQLNDGGDIDLPGLSALPNINFIVEGAVETIDGRMHQKLSVTADAFIQITAVKIKLNFDTYALADSEIAIEKTLPADAVDVTDTEAFDALISDPDVMNNLRKVLSDLGLDPSSFLPGADREE